MPTSTYEQPYRADSSSVTLAGPRTPLVKVTVRRGDIFRRFTQLQFMKMDPHVEVAISGRPIGSVPPALGGDQEPRWNYALPPQEFELGDELQLTVLNRSVLRKDVLIGSGAVKLSLELFSSERRAVEQTVKLFKKHDGEKPEHTGNVQVCLNFLTMGMRERSDSKGTDLTAMSLGASSSSIPSRPSGMRVQGDTGGLPHDRSAMPASASSSALFHQSPCANGTQSADSRGWLRDDASNCGYRYSSEFVVAHQYWEREIRPRRQPPVLCTDAVRQLLLQCRLTPRRCAACAGVVVWLAAAIHVL